MELVLNKEVDTYTMTSIRKAISSPNQTVGTSKQLDPVALNASSAALWTPASGKTIILKSFSVSVSTATRIDFQWDTANFMSFYLPANGSVAMNLTNSNRAGGAKNTALNVYSSASATVTASAGGEEL